jgi:hypothetical protein
MDSENGTFVKLGKICPILKGFLISNYFKTENGTLKLD